MTTFIRIEHSGQPLDRVLGSMARSVSSEKQSIKQYALVKEVLPLKTVIDTPADLVTYAVPKDSEPDVSVLVVR